MAQLAKKSYPGDWSFESADWNERHSRQLEHLQEASAKVDPSVSLVGALVIFPWADGNAMYRVSKDKPLTLQHIPAFDAWQVPYSQIRGTRRADVVAMVESERKIRELFAKKT